MSQQLHTSETQTEKAQQQPVVAGFGADIQGASNEEKTVANTESGSDALGSFRSFWGKARRAAIEQSPALLVNNSSNVLGAAHVATEMLMFKAGSSDAKLIQNPSNPINWIKEPVKTIFVDTFKKAKSDVPVRELLFKGNPIKNIYTRVTDVDAATNRVRQSPENKGKLPKDIKFPGHWQMRSTFAGLVVWGLSALIPENKEDPEELERMAIKSRTNPVGYGLERIKQAIWFPEWRDNKRQMIGLGIAASGVSSIIGAWRGRAAAVDGGKKFSFNGGYLGTALFTLASSFPLLFASDNQRGYGAFGSLMMGRLLFLPSSIRKKFSDRDPGRHWYTTATLSFQAENVAQSLIGGAEKLPDGTIVDHDEIRKSAKAKAEAIIKARRKGGTLEEDASVPETKVDSVKHMERVEERAEERVAG